MSPGPTPETGKSSVFPSTAVSWIDEHLSEGEAGRAEINRHVMLVYATPLQRYLGRTPYRSLGEPADLVAGFFADRLERAEFLREWRGSGKRLRHWLCNALTFFLKESSRQRTRDARYRELAHEVPDGGPPPEDVLDRAFALSVIQVALAQTRESLEVQGCAQHYEIFHEHHARGIPYGQLARVRGLPAARAQVMGRTGREAFRRCLRRLVGRDCGRLEDVDGEVDALLESLR